MGVHPCPGWWGHRATPHMAEVGFQISWDQDINLCKDKISRPGFSQSSETGSAPWNPIPPPPTQRNEKLGCKVASGESLQNLSSDCLEPPSVSSLMRLQGVSDSSGFQVLSQMLNRSLGKVSATQWSPRSKEKVTLFLMSLSEPGPGGPQNSKLLLLSEAKWGTMFALSPSQTEISKREKIVVGKGVVAVALIFVFFGCRIK